MAGTQVLIHHFLIRRVHQQEAGSYAEQLGLKLGPLTWVAGILRCDVNTTKMPSTNWEKANINSFQATQKH